MIKRWDRNKADLEYVIEKQKIIKYICKEYYHTKIKGADTINEIIENILDANPSKVELSIVDYQDEGIKLEVFLLDEKLHVLDIFTARSGNPGKLVNIMRELWVLINEVGIECECIDGIQRC